MRTHMHARTTHRHTHKHTPGHRTGRTRTQTTSELAVETKHVAPSPLHGQLNIGRPKVPVLVFLRNGAHGPHDNSHVRARMQARARARAHSRAPSPPHPCISDGTIPYWRLCTAATRALPAETRGRRGKMARVRLLPPYGCLNRHRIMNTGTHRAARSAMRRLAGLEKEERVLHEVGHLQRRGRGARHHPHGWHRRVQTALCCPRQLGKTRTSRPMPTAGRRVPAPASLRAAAAGCALYSMRGQAPCLVCGHDKADHPPANPPPPPPTTTTTVIGTCSRAKHAAKPSANTIVCPADRARIDAGFRRARGARTK